MENNVKTGVIYARTSSSGSLENRQNCERQFDDLNRYASSFGINVVKTFKEAISGAKLNTERDILQSCIQYCIEHRVDVLMVSELSRLGRNAFEVLSTVKQLIDNKINLYCDKERLNLLDNTGRPSVIAPIMIAVLGTCAQMERENIQYRLESGRNRYVRNGGKLGRKIGYRKPIEEKRRQYANTIKLIQKGCFTLKEIAKLSGVGVSTVQRLKKEFYNECTA